ncbi:MAG: hypothetical protein CTY12_07880 [Methylotenera sp.]|nr:MAG: hypothetical protein CTY12_07880 [Methylotenera sp.]
MLKFVIMLLFLVGCATESEITTLRVEISGLEGAVNRVQQSASEAKLAAFQALGSAAKAEHTALEAETALKAVNDRLDQELANQ